LPPSFLFGFGMSQADADIGLRKVHFCLCLAYTRRIADTGFPTMKVRLLSLLFLLPMAAQADTLFKCTDETGQVLYTNQKGASKSCTVLSRDQPISTFTAPKAKASANLSPSDFPRVNGDQQKTRDNDRRVILDQELRSEQKQLEDAKKALAEQDSRIEPSERNIGGTVNQAKVQERLKAYRDSVQLHERNIDALNKEIGNLK